MILTSVFKNIIRNYEAASRFRNKPLDEADCQTAVLHSFYYRSTQNTNEGKSILMCSDLIPGRPNLIELYGTLLLPHGHLPSTQSTHLDHFVLLFFRPLSALLSRPVINYAFLLLPLLTAVPFVFINLVYFIHWTVFYLMAIHVYCF